MTRTLTLLSLAVLSNLGCHATAEAATQDGESAAAALPPGFESLFDGKTLSGWTEQGGRYDGDADWTVEDGCIVGRVGDQKNGGLLYTERVFTSFELELETRIDFPFDSGVFLRMWPEGKGAQVTLDYRPDGEVCGIYSDGWLEHHPEGKARFRENDWNHLRVRCTGFDMRIQVELNGEALVDYTLPAGSEGYAPSGRIGVQVHGDRNDPAKNAARFRNLRVRELPLFDPTLFEADRRFGVGLVQPSSAGKAAGWVQLFNGENLEGWGSAGPRGGYSFANGALEIPSKGGGGHVFTQRDDYRDFRLRLDFQMARMANSGVYLRSVNDGTNPSYSGCEVQILDDFNWENVTGTALKETQFCGSLYGAVAPSTRSALRPPGAWNTYEILYQGTRLAVALNGHTLYDVDTTRVPGDPPFDQRAQAGFIGIQRYDAPVEDAVTLRCRNVLLQEL